MTDQVIRLFPLPRKPPAAPPRSPTAPATLGNLELGRFRLDALAAGAPPKRKMLLAPLIPLGVVSVLFGEGGLGKSILALDLALAVARRALQEPGKLDFAAGPLGGNIPAEAGGASIFLTLEDDAGEVHRRAQAIDPDGTRQGAPCFVIPGDALPGWDPTLVETRGRTAALTDFARRDLADLLARVADQADMPVRLLVLDPAGDFLNADENDAAPVKLLMRTLRDIASKFGCTILLLGHTPKAAPGLRPTMRGSGAWISNSRAAYGIWRPAPEEAAKLAKQAGVAPDTIVFGSLVKANHDGAPIDFRRVFTRCRTTGRLVEIMARIEGTEAIDDSLLMASLVDACRMHAEAGMPFAYSGASGLWVGREDLPPELAALPKAKLEAIGTAALAAGKLVKAKTTPKEPPKWLDVPDGALSRGVPVLPVQGSRREALASLRANAR